MSPNRQRAKALIIDKQSNWQGWLLRICQDLRFNPKVTNSLEEAYQALNSANFAVIILDMIPTEEEMILGYDERSATEIDIFLTYIANQHVNTPILLLS